MTYRRWIKVFGLSLAVLMQSSSAWCQELIPFRKSDVFAEPIKSKFLVSSIRAGYDHNYQFRNHFTGNDLFFAHLDNNFYIFRGDSIFPGFHFDYEFTYLSVSDSVTPMLTNKIAASAYLDQNGGYKLGLSRYDFPNDVQWEWSIEIVIRLIESINSSGGFIFARNTSEKTHYYQIGYRYLLTRSYTRNVVQLGWAYARGKLPDLLDRTRDRGSKVKFELSYQRDFKGLPPIVVSGSASRDFVGKQWYFETAIMIDITFLRAIWFDHPDG